MTAMVGTPSIIPGSPNRPPPTMMAKSTQKLASLVVFPNILGAIMLPSICWSISISRANLTAAHGSMNKSSTPDGTAPINGPKKGITSVIPTTTLMSRANGSPNMLMAIKHSMPTIMESMIFPLINPPKVS